MSMRRLAAGILAVADAALGAYLGYSFPSPGRVLLWISVLLLVVSLLCLYGVHFAFLGGAVLSILLPGLATLTKIPTALQLAFLVLSLLAMAMNILAYRSTTHLSEQANPMNLPVFG
jgi:membrane protein implicated in regulation of membrane protease activity